MRDERWMRIDKQNKLKSIIFMVPCEQDDIIGINRERETGFLSYTFVYGVSKNIPRAKSAHIYSVKIEIDAVSS